MHTAQISPLRPVFLRLAGLLLCSTLALSGCKTAEEKAEDYYQSGMTLLEAGDVDRALVEFRNVFQLDGRHKNARLTYARLMRERGDLDEAYGQYLRLVEQYPETFEAQLALAEMAIDNQDWEEAERHGRRAGQMAPADPAARAVVAALDYRTAKLNHSKRAAAAPVAAAQSVLKDLPGSLIAWRIVIDDALDGRDTATALTIVDAAIAQFPNVLDFHMNRLQLLSEGGDPAAVGQQLEAMQARFADNQQVNALLITWYLGQGDLAAAEGFLRKLAANAQGDPEPQLDVVRFLANSVNPDRAVRELDRLIAASDATPEIARLYRGERAKLRFSLGAQQAAINELTEALQDAPISVQNHDLQIVLAGFLDETGDVAGAKALVETVLAEDPTQVAALKLRAGWQIDDDRPGDAIMTLRTALDQAPDDVEALTLMGQAHDRDGSHELAGERYSLAVELSGQDPERVLHYARFLLDDGKAATAEAVVKDALRLHAGNVRLLAALADLQLLNGDWDKAEDTLVQLRAIGSPDAKAAANMIEAGLLLRQDRLEDTISFLQGLVASGDGGTAAIATIIQAQVREGQLDQARLYLDRQLTATPDDPTLRFLSAGLHVMSGDAAMAEAIYLDLIREEPGKVDVVAALYGLYETQGRTTEAAALLDNAHQANPADATLQLIRAAHFEQTGDIEGAIATYEALYKADGSNDVVANNLASLLATHREDAASLERAFAIARRLRGSDEPAFQDTYGWIEFRRGNLEEALSYLERAARGLPDDAMVQVHLGLAQAALGRSADARATLTTALDMAGNDPAPSFAQGRRILAGLPAPE
jgi:Flp pilus assembly protein TadD